MHGTNLLCLLFLTSVWIVGCEGRGVPPETPSRPSQWQGITIYNWDVISEGYTPPSLVDIPRYEADETATKRIVSELKYQSREPMWKGSCLGIVRLKSGDECRIAISLTMGFFKILDEPGYYDVQGEARGELDHIMDEVFRSFDSARSEGESGLHRAGEPLQDE